MLTHSVNEGFKCMMRPKVKGIAVEMLAMSFYPSLALYQQRGRVVLKPSI